MGKEELRKAFQAGREETYRIGNSKRKFYKHKTFESWFQKREEKEKQEQSNVSMTPKPEFR